MEAATFIRSWPGSYLLVWGAAAMQVVIAQLAPNCILPYAVKAAIPQHPALALVLYKQQQQPSQAKSVVQQLYGASKGCQPMLLIDASIFEQTLGECRGRDAWSIALPAQTCGWAQRLESGPLYDAVLGTLTLAAEPEEAFAFCTSYECLCNVDPEIRCLYCGAAFCSSTCNFQASHFCRQ
jgi:hypothetical protein